MSQYENAPATKMVATHCVCCARPLVDAKSVERGVGPDCAKKYGFEDAQCEPNWDIALKELGSSPVSEKVNTFWRNDARIVCNALVYQIAANKTDKFVPNLILAIYHLGYHNLASCLVTATNGISVYKDGESFVVNTPFSNDWNFIARGIKGQYFDRKIKARIVPIDQKLSLWKALCAAFPGSLCVGDNGIKRLIRAS